MIFPFLAISTFPLKPDRWCRRDMYSSISGFARFSSYNKVRLSFSACCRAFFLVELSLLVKLQEDGPKIKRTNPKKPITILYADLLKTLKIGMLTNKSKNFLFLKQKL